MAQTYTLEEAAQRLDLPVDEFKKKLREEWKSVRSFRDGATLRFRSNDIEELARPLGQASDPGLPLGQEPRHSHGRHPPDRPDLPDAGLPGRSLRAGGGRAADRNAKEDQSRKEEEDRRRAEQAREERAQREREAEQRQKEQQEKERLATEVRRRAEAEQEARKEIQRQADRIRDLQEKEQLAAAKQQLEEQRKKAIPVVPYVAVPPPPVVRVAKRILAAGDKFALDLPGGVKMAFAWCPPGTFLMGSPSSEKERRDDEQQHEVRLTKGFYAGVHPVTQVEWTAVMNTDPCHFKGANLPVEQVSWDDAQAFCTKVRELTGKQVRLPTEAEREYACRGGTTTPFYWVGELNGSQANCDGRTPYGTSTMGPYLQKTTPVGRYAKKFSHPWGLTDVLGNVWEWCADWYDAGYFARSPKDDPECRNGKQMYRILRGGSWRTLARSCRAAYRNRVEPAYRSDGIGFRVVFCLD